MCTVHWIAASPVPCFKTQVVCWRHRVSLVDYRRRFGDTGYSITQTFGCRFLPAFVLWFFLGLNLVPAAFTTQCSQYRLPNFEKKAQKKDVALLRLQSWLHISKILLSLVILG